MTMHKLAPIALGNLCPLFLVMAGWVEVPDLMMAYVAETVLLMVLCIPALVRDLKEGGDKRMVLLAVFVPMLVAYLGLYVVDQVSWDVESLFSIVVISASLLWGVADTLRQARPGEHPFTSPVGSFAWRLLLLLVGCVAIDLARSYAELKAAGWEPAPLGSGVSHRVGELILSSAMAVGLSTTVLPAAVLIGYRTVNEVLFAALRMELLADRRAEGPSQAEIAARWSREWRANARTSTKKPAADKATPTNAGER